MNKAKVMLSALGICAVLATTFAFTAQKFNNKIVYTGTSSTDCTHPVLKRILTTDTVNGSVFATLISGATCSPTYTIATTDNN